MVNTHSEGNQSAVCSSDQVYDHHLLSVRPSAISLTVLLSSKRNTRSSPRSVSGAASADAAWSASPQSLSSSSSCNWTDGHRLCGKFPSITQQIKRPISPRSLGDPIRVSFNGVSGSSSSSSRYGQSFVAPFPGGCCCCSSSHLLQQEHNQCARLCSTFPASQSARARFHQPAVDPSSSPSSSECMKKRLIR